ncbi:MAG: aa3-type cytochrome c oxidase subunit IV [Alphaproteobacteria bacterium]|nr:aa3-type cytochrome c oxidase subunit IV [Alphaproteobacteria bacterium]
MGGCGCGPSQSGRLIAAAGFRLEAISGIAAARATARVQGRPGFMAHERQEDFPTHLRGWSSFVMLLTVWSMIVVIILVLMALFLL